MIDHSVNIGYSLLSVERAYRKGKAEAIEKFINKIIESPRSRTWCCDDLMMEYCDGNECDICKETFKSELLEIAEQLEEQK